MSSQDESQGLIAETRPWIPEDKVFRSSSQVPSHAQFAIATTPEDILERSTNWIQQDGITIGRYLAEGLRDYLNPNNAAPAVHEKRLRAFEAKTVAALNASAPLVKVNPAVLVNVHNADRAGYSSHFGEIPLQENTPAREVFVNILENRHEMGEHVTKAFSDGNGEFIDIFTHLNAAYEPVVFDSLMKPIVSDWDAKSKTEHGLTQFWENRRSRSMTEFLPMSPEVLTEMITGWYVASRLGHLRIEPQQVRIYAPATSLSEAAWLRFPVPGLRGFDHRPGPDSLADVLGNIVLAMAEVNTRESIAPLAPYARLRQLGSAANGELEDYIRDGSNAFSEKAATGLTAAERRTQVEGELTKVQGKLQGYFRDLENRYKDPLNVPPIWDLRDSIDSALTVLVTKVKALDSSAAGSVDDFN